MKNKPPFFYFKYVLITILLYPLTHLTIFDKPFWLYSFWLTISLLVTILMETCSIIIKANQQ